MAEAANRSALSSGRAERRRSSTSYVISLSAGFGTFAARGSTTEGGTGTGGAYGTSPPLLL